MILNEILDPESIQFEVSEHENQGSHILSRGNESLSEQEKHAKKMRELELQQKYLEMKYHQNEEQRRQIAHQNEEQRKQNEEQRKKERHEKEMAQDITCTEILSFMWGLVWPSTSAKISLRRSSRELHVDKCDIVLPQLKKVQ